MKWFKNLRVKPKLIISFCIVMAFSIVSAALAIITVNKLDNSYSYLLNFPQKRSEYLMQVNTDCAVIRRTASAIAINASNPEAVGNYYGQFEKAYYDAIDNVNKYLENNSLDTVRDPETISQNNQIILDVKSKIESYKEQADKGVDVARATGDAEKTNEIFLALAPVMAEVSDNIAEFIPKAAAYTDEVSAANTDEKDYAIVMFIILLVVTAIFSIIIVRYVSSIISKPLIVLTKFMKKAGSTGDIALNKKDIDIIEELSQVKDEIGQCVESTADFVKHMMKVSDQMGVVAGGDLTAGLAPLSDDDVMAISLNKMIDNLSSIFGDLRVASGQVSAGAGQVSQAAQSLASGSSQQAASIEEFTASLTELGDKTRENAGSSERAREANEKASLHLMESMRSMSDLLEAMRSIDESSNSITKVIKVIDDIAFQTNILALNAAVEAARAGQHGKGFAVVADEVRNLASKSAAAAKETAALIEGSSGRVSEGNQIVAKTNTGLESVLEYAQELAGRVNEVASASVEQARSIEIIQQGIEQISTVVQANSATAEQSAAAAQEMSAQSVMLDEIVTQFKLKQPDSQNIGPSPVKPVDYGAPVIGIQSDKKAFALSNGKY